MYKKSLERAGLFFLPGLFFINCKNTQIWPLQLMWGSSGCLVQGNGRSMAWAVPRGAGPQSHRFTPAILQRGSLFGESACAVVSGTCSSEMLGWEKQQLDCRGHGLHPALRVLPESVMGAHEGWSPERHKAAVSVMFSCLCMAFWSRIARFPTRHWGPMLASLSP